MCVFCLLKVIFAMHEYTVNASATPFSSQPQVHRSQAGYITFFDFFSVFEQISIYGTTVGTTCLLFMFRLLALAINWLFITSCCIAIGQ